jgi:hypothetical protein
MFPLAKKNFRKIFQEKIVVKEDIQDIVVGHKKMKFLEFLTELDNPGPVHQE